MSTQRTEKENRTAPSSTPSDARIVAFIDMGTNSIRLLMVRINPNHSCTVLTQLKQTVRLGEGEFAEHMLQPKAMDRAVLVVQKFANLARSYGAEEIVAAATAATREAENQDVFVDRLWREARIDMRVVSGLEEARLIYLGVSSGVHLEDQQALLIDIGGGSTEIIVGSQQQHHYLDSLKLGAIRLTLRFLPDAQGPVALSQYELIQRYVRHYAVATVRQASKHRIDLGIGSSGTIENLANIAMRMVCKRRLQRGDVLSHAHLKQTVEMLCSLPLEARRKVPGLNPERADIIVPGAAILDTLMDELKLPEIRITDRGLRDGLLVDYLLKKGHAPLLADMSVRERSILQLGRTCNFDEAHGRTAAHLALALFDSARSVRLHSLGNWERELLKYAALLHDIGGLLTYNNHQAHTYYLIRNADLLGFDQTEVAIIASTAFYHRKALPRKKHPQFAALDKRSRKIVLVLCVLLRIAENLDRSHAALVRHARLCAADKKQITLQIDTGHDCQVEIWGLQNHLDAFEKVFGRKLKIEVAKPEDA